MWRPTSVRQFTRQKKRWHIWLRIFKVVHKISILLQPSLMWRPTSVRQFTRQKKRWHIWVRIFKVVHKNSILLQPSLIWRPTSVRQFTRQKKQWHIWLRIFKVVHKISILVKFMFSKKAIKIDEISTVDLTLCSKCQIGAQRCVLTVCFPADLLLWQ